MILSARFTELVARTLAGQKVNFMPWLDSFSQKWLQKNKPSELFRIQEMLDWFNQ
jgi:hypothetical protein